MQQGEASSDSSRVLLLHEQMGKIKQNVHKIKDNIKVFHELSTSAASWLNFNWSVFRNVSDWLKILLMSLAAIAIILIIIYFGFYVGITLCCKCFKSCMRSVKQPHTPTTSHPINMMLANNGPMNPLTYNKEKF